MFSLFRSRTVSDNDDFLSVAGKKKSIQMHIFTYVNKIFLNMLCIKMTIFIIKKFKNHFIYLKLLKIILYNENIIFLYYCLYIIITLAI